MSSTPRRLPRTGFEAVGEQARSGGGAIDQATSAYRPLRSEPERQLLAGRRPSQSTHCGPKSLRTPSVARRATGDAAAALRLPSPRGRIGLIYPLFKAAISGQDTLPRGARHSLTSFDSAATMRFKPASLTRTSANCFAASSAASPQCVPSSNRCVREPVRSVNRCSCADAERRHASRRSVQQRSKKARNCRVNGRTKVIDARIRMLLFVLPIMLSGCATLSPYGKKWNGVYVTDNKDIVSACKYVDVFHSWPPYILPNGDIRNITRRAAAVGANTVLVEGPRIVSTKGQAYKCTGS